MSGRGRLARGISPQTFLACLDEIDEIDKTDEIVPARLREASNGKPDFVDSVDSVDSVDFVEQPNTGEETSPFSAAYSCESFSRTMSAPRARSDASMAS